MRPDDSLIQSFSSAIRRRDHTQMSEDFKHKVVQREYYAIPMDIREKSVLEDCIQKFLSVLSSRHGSTILTIWNANPLLRDYFCGKTVVIEGQEFQGSLSLKVRFQKIMLSRCVTIIKTSWDNIQANPQWVLEFQKDPEMGAAIAKASGGHGVSAELAHGFFEKIVDPQVLQDCLLKISPGKTSGRLNPLVSFIKNRIAQLKTIPSAEEKEVETSDGCKIGDKKKREADEAGAQFWSKRNRNHFFSSLSSSPEKMAAAINEYDSMELAQSEIILSLRKDILDGKYSIDQMSDKLKADWQAWNNDYQEWEKRCQPFLEALVSGHDQLTDEARPPQDQINSALVLLYFYKRVLGEKLLDRDQTENSRRDCQTALGFIAQALADFKTLERGLRDIFQFLSQSQLLNRSQVTFASALPPGL